MKPLFWKSMIYACSECTTEFTFLLEAGLEGPRDQAAFADRVAGSLEVEREYLVEVVARNILPVPFVAGGCPKCQGAPPWNIQGPTLRHIRWHHDEHFEVPKQGEPDGPFFAYPEDPGKERACGVPVVPGVFDGREL